MMRQPSILLHLILLSWVVVTSAKKQRVLVILDSPKVKDTHGLFFADLEKSGYELTFKTAGDKSVALERYGEGQYDHLILLAPTSKTWGKKVGQREILDFVDQGRNVILVGTSDMSKGIFDTAAEFGIDFETPKSKAVDHVHHAKVMKEDKWVANHALLVVEPEPLVRALFNRDDKDAEVKPLLFEGIGHSVSPDADQVTVGLAGNPTSYTYSISDVDDDRSVAGRDLTFVSLIQMQNNARVTIVGSMAFFSDALFTMKFIPARSHRSEGITSGNRAFAHHLALWTFQSMGVLRTQTPRHYYKPTGISPSMYTIRDPIRFEVDIHEYTVDKWIPYRADDIQLEYYMMFPYIRTVLRDNSNGTFSVDLMAPDVTGVFKFLIQYRRPGYSNIDITEMAPIRPFRHNEYERFIPTAYPYYVSMMSIMLAFWLLGVCFLYHK